MHSSRRNFFAQADRAASNWIPTFTSFLPPPSAMSIKSMVDQLAHVVAHDWGGYPQAERCRIILARDELMDQFKEDPEQSGAVAAVKVAIVNMLMIIFLVVMQEDS